MDYKATLEKQIETLEKLQHENISNPCINIVEKTENAVKIADEINRLVAHAREIKTA